jgi:hypothetical protein
VAVGAAPPPAWTPPPWSPATGPLRPLAEQLENQQRSVLLSVGWVLVAALVLAPSKPWVPGLLAGVGGLGLLLGRTMSGDGLRWGAIQLARQAPVDVPVRARHPWWPWIRGSLPAVPLLGLAANAAEDNVVWVLPALTGPLLIVAAQSQVIRRARERLASWEREHGLRVLTPVGWRNPARGGYYVAPRTTEFRQRQSGGQAVADLGSVLRPRPPSPDGSQ